jgi:hypothetical protein
MPSVTMRAGKKALFHGCFALTGAFIRCSFMPLRPLKDLPARKLTVPAILAALAAKRKRKSYFSAREEC